MVEHSCRNGQDVHFVLTIKIEKQDTCFDAACSQYVKIIKLIFVKMAMALYSCNFIFILVAHFNHIFQINHNKNITFSSIVCEKLIFIHVFHKKERAFSHLKKPLPSICKINMVFEENTVKVMFFKLYYHYFRIQG